MNSLQFSVFKVSILILHLIPILLAFQSLASYASTYAAPVSKENICKLTPNPSFCESILHNHTTNVYDSGRYVVRKSLSQSQSFLKLVSMYFQSNSTLSNTAVLALVDCMFLVELSVDFLARTLKAVSKSNQTLPSSKASDVLTLMSTVITNQQTCFDGLQANSDSSSWRNGLLVPLSNDLSLYSVSLALFTKGWVPRKKEEKEIFTWTKQVPRSFDDVVVKETVTVSKDGSGNSTSINDAL